MATPLADAGPDQSFAFAALPTTALMAGGGTDPDGGALTGYAWQLLEKPSGSAAALSSLIIQNPTLNGIDTVGTYLLFLIVTDDEAEDSESDPLLAPTAARIQVTVSTQYAALIKPAPSERDWHPDYYEVVDEVDDLRRRMDSDVGERTFQASVNGTLLAGGVHPAIVDVDVDGKPCIAWRAHADLEIDEFSIRLADAGGAAARYVFNLYVVSEVNFLAVNYPGGTHVAQIDRTQAGGDAGKPASHNTVLATPAPVTEGQILAIICEIGPLTGGKATGRDLTAQVKWREV